MKINDIISNDYFRLFVKREGKVVLGKKYSNLWLLSAVLFATFLAIAFSNASLYYLDIKMNDPFINWVDIKNNYGEDDFIGFEEALKDGTIMEQYHFNGYQTDKYKYTLFATANADSKPLDCRFFADIQTPLVRAILDDENVISNKCINKDALINSSYGVIITQDALVNKLRYTNEIPAFIRYRAYCSEGADEEFGAEIVNEHYSDVPIPVLAVVKRLPTNMDIIGTKHFYNQNSAYAFNMYEPSYFCSLIYFVPNKVNASDFAAFMEKTALENTGESFYISDNFELPEMATHANGRFVALRYDYEEDADFEENRNIHNAIMEKYGSKGVVRVFQYIATQSAIADADDYISVHFDDLNMISDFQEYTKDKFKINIEMSQINAKENFNEVSIMANILSWTMIVFAIICIILFIVNLLQSYFQKVKRNLGTFKAFGMGSKQLISVYVLIMVAIICVAIIISASATLIIQGLLPVLGILKDGMFNYIALWSGKTLCSVIIIIVASVSTVYIVMNNLLKATPGDLIYDR